MEVCSLTRFVSPRFLPRLFRHSCITNELKTVCQGTYKFPLHLCCATALVGGILYALAYRAHFLYLVLISRIVTGVSFAQFMYSERYCSDPRIVGVRRRTALAGWLLAGQSTGYTVGPFVGGLLYNVGFENAIFNGYTSPGWVTAAVWLVFWVVVTVLFEDVPRRDGRQAITPKTETGTRTLSPAPVEPTQDTTSPENDVPPEGNISVQQWAVTTTMSWFAMTCFFVLSAWEANIPIFVAHKFGASPFVAGNLLALGSAGTFPFMFAPMVLERHVQDRHILAASCVLGLLGLVVAIPVAGMGHATLGGLFACWFFVKLGFSLARKVSLKLLRKQMPYAWNGKISMFIQYSNCSGRVSGATWGGAGVEVGMTYYLGLQFALLGLGALMFMNIVKGNEGKVVKQVSSNCQLSTYNRRGSSPTDPLGQVSTV